MNGVQHFLLALILLVSLGLRVAYNTELLPPLNLYPNEMAKVNRGLGSSKVEVEGYDKQPSFLTNGIWLIHFPARWFGLTGRNLFPETKPFSLPANIYYLWMGRTYMAVLGTITVWLAFLLGRSLGGTSAGLLAAMALAVTPIHVLNCRYTKEDVPLALFGTLALFFNMGVLRRGSKMDYAKAGLAIGFCFSTKWLGAIWWAPLLAAHWLRRALEKKTARPAAPRRRLGWAALFFVIGFYALSPDMALELKKPYHGARRGFRHATSAEGDDVSVKPFSDALADYFEQAMWWGMTPTLLAAAAAGWVWLRRRQRNEATLLGGWIAFFYLLLEMEPTRAYPNYQRYFLPAIPCLAALAGCGMVALADGLRSLPRAGRLLSPRWGIALAAALVLALPLQHTIRYLAAIPDNTLKQALGFIQETLPKDALIFTDKYAPLLDRYGFRTQEIRDADKLLVEVFPPEPCYLMFSSLGWGRYLERPQSDPGMTRFLYYALSHGELAGQWTPRFRTYYHENPTIKLLRFGWTKEPYQVPRAHIGKKKKRSGPLPPV